MSESVNICSICSIRRYSERVSFSWPQFCRIANEQIKFIKMFLFVIEYSWVHRTYSIRLYTFSCRCRCWLNKRMEKLWPHGVRRCFIMMDSNSIRKMLMLSSAHSHPLPFIIPNSNQSTEFIMFDTHYVCVIHIHSHVNMHSMVGHRQSSIAFDEKTPKSTLVSD